MEKDVKELQQEIDRLKRQLYRAQHIDLAISFSGLGIAIVCLLSTIRFILF